MEYNTVLFILNDAFGEIDKDPTKWWREVKNHVLSAPYEKAHGYAFGIHANAYEVTHCDHSTVEALIFAGRNHSRVLALNSGAGGVAELLRIAADNLGYDLIPRAGT